jgi:PBP1b-binding outer membrane lipoprotein LpoB
MKTSMKSKIALVMLVAGLSFACKKNETAPVDENKVYDDTTTTAVDTMNTMSADTTMVDSAKTVTPAQ